jgi:hypothetical protein
MDGRPAGPLCCGRCGGLAAAVRTARRQRFRAAVSARPGAGLPAAPGAGRAGRTDRMGPTGRADRAGQPCNAGHPGGTAPPDSAGYQDGAGHPGGTAPPDSAGHRDGAGHPGSRATNAGRFRTVTGTLLDTSPQILVVATDEGERRLALTPAASVWHGGPVEATGLRPGEQVLIRLAPGRSNVADKVWASIGRVAGTISASGDGQLMVDEGTTRRRQAVVIAPAAANRIRVRFPQLEPGSLIDVIGLRRGSLLEALIPSTSQPAYLASKVTRGQAVARTAAGTFSGSVTWHEPAGPGEEPRGAAYPAIDPAAGCAEAPLTAPCPAELPYLAVGSMLSVRNECTGATRVLPVTGCAAAARLFHDRCLTCGTSPRGRVADLTLASFAELGGDPERACFNATVSVWP